MTTQSGRASRAVYAALLSLAITPAPVLADVSPLPEAEKLVASGQLQAAYALLAPHEFEYAGNPKFDLMFGYAALETGNVSIASLAFERVLAVEPNNPEARLHLARAYYALNDPTQAQHEFESLLAANPPQSIRETIGQYMSVLQQRQTPKKLQLSAYLEGTGGYDSNVTGAPARSAINIPIDPGQLQLPQSAVEKGSPYASISGGANLAYAIRPDLVAYAGADLQSRLPPDVAELDYIYLGGRTGISKQFDNQTVRAGFNGSHFILNGDPFRDSAGAELEYRRAFDNRLQASVVGGFTAYRHVPTSSVGEDYNLYSASASAVKVLGASGNHLISLAFDYGNEDDLHSRADGNRNYFGPRLSGQSQLAEKINVFGSVGYQYSDFDRGNTVFLTERTDKQWNLSAGLNYLVTPTFVIRPTVTWLDQSSNIPLYDYSRWTASVTLHVDFF